MLRRIPLGNALIVRTSKLSDHLGVLRRDVHFLIGVRRDVLQFLVVDEPPTLRSNRAIFECTAVRIGAFITKVPLAKETGFVTSLMQQFWKRRRRQRHPLAFFDRMRHTIPELMSTAKDRRTRRRTCGADMKFGKPSGHRMKSIQVGSP